MKTDVFRDQVQLNEKLRQQLSVIREIGKNREKREEAKQALLTFQKTLGELDAAEAGTIIDLFLSYRALEDWGSMIALYEQMPGILKRQILVQQQLGFAYNRRAAQTKNTTDRTHALRILEAVEEQQGPNSETCGLIGRIHKDNWKGASDGGRDIEARGHLNKSIQAYVRGFMADQRDAYPGINAVTLLEIKGDEPSLKQKTQLLPVVRFAVEQRLANALTVVRESWEPATTADNLRLIERARKMRQLDTSWLLEIIRALETWQR